MKPILVEGGAATHVGARRSLNEDSHLAEAPLFLVADGMGGHDRGEIASATAIEAFLPLVGRASLSVDEARDAFERARGQVDRISAARDRGAGTTFAGVIVTEVDGAGYWLAINLGDSRVYRMRGGVLEQISVDHSVVQELLDAGQISPEEAARDRRRNVITRAMGAGSSAHADYWMLPAARGDRMPVCSDGMSNELSRDRIAVILRGEAKPQAAADRLVLEALEHGGRDNITAVVVDAVAVSPRMSHEVIDEDTRPRESVAG
ncbi:PP2C family protein-serine/threonine phosphatase [Microbacterium sediminis]|uniref:Serine/threonine protein phosphatase n=1 Tax=Microbacterium sediminis TaxID=904291 RepID=A0A1B9NAN1_9MICO|nr:protein phosphatase 2C domain-containing protein [Microbacterium sediminis]OCG73594.1 serine/threonine protein phosphatase [Microbacterium sediminis]